MWDVISPREESSTAIDGNSPTLKAASHYYIALAVVYKINYY